MADFFTGLALTLCLLSFVPTHAERTTRPKLYTVNLDLPAKQRWVHIVKDLKNLPNDVNKVISMYVPSFVIPFVDKIAASLNSYLPQPYTAEIEGIAKALNTNVGTILMPNIAYEVIAFCTSIVAQNKEGQIWHGRNIDLEFTDKLRNYTVDINFERGGKTLYTATTFAGTVGIFTGQKPYGFTISIDQRTEGALWINVITAIFEKKSKFLSFLVRDTLEKASDFKSAIEMLAHCITIAPDYLIVGGTKPGEGAVITRDHLKARDIWFLNSTANRWFLVETNYDHWVAPPLADKRRAAAMKYLEAVGRGSLNERAMFKVLSTPPLLKPMTVYTSVMSAQQPQKYKSWVRHLKRGDYKLRYQHINAFKKTNRYTIL